MTPTPQDRFEKASKELLESLETYWADGDMTPREDQEEMIENDIKVIAAKLRTLAQEYEAEIARKDERIKELEAEILRLSRIADGWALKCDDFRWKVSSLEALLEEAKEAFKRINRMTRVKSRINYEVCPALQKLTEREGGKE